jgi:hypothetical protein
MSSFSQVVGEVINSHQQSTALTASLTPIVSGTARPLLVNLNAFGVFHGGGESSE